MSYKKFDTKQSLDEYAKSVSKWHCEWVIDHKGKYALVQGLRTCWTEDDDYITPAITNLLCELIKYRLPPHIDASQFIEEHEDIIFQIVLDNRWDLVKLAEDIAETSTVMKQNG